MNKGRLGYVSLFSSAGVGCYGFSLEGFDCIATSELIQRRIAVQKANNVCSLEDGYVAGDFTLDATKQKVFTAIDQWKSTYGRDEVDVVVATPPCQGISVANHKKNNEIKRNSLVVDSLRLIDQIKPRFFILENVRGFLNTLCTDIDNVDKKISEAIFLNLAGNYNIAHKVINFKDFGNNSSRTRTVVIGVRKDIENITPYDLFPSEQEAPTLRELIGHLPALKTMGEISSKDIYHAFRKYDPRMLNWIIDIKEGQSAFDNTDPKKQPHKVIDGKIIINANKNGDKYSRCYWDKVAPCVHTRNDILASQATVHPRDNRVFSIRELMHFMTIPESFKWTPHTLEELNKLSPDEKRSYLKTHEINIRQSLGEAVPTSIFNKIAKNIKEKLTETHLSLNQVRRLIDKQQLGSVSSLLNYMDHTELDFTDAARIAEIANAKRLDDGAFYTRQELCFNLVSDLPDFKNKKSIRILEPSVGVGNFLPSLFQKYKHIETVRLDLVDINGDSLTILKKLLKFIDVPRNFEIRFINDDFLAHEFRAKYDLVVGNPPFGSIKAVQFNSYMKQGLGSIIKSKNLFALFFEKSLKIGEYVALFSPKSLLSAPEFDSLRELLASKAILKISDYGEKGFAGVKIETISTQVSNSSKPGNTIVDSYILNSYKIHPQGYLISSDFPTWLIYRDEFFDNMKDRINLDSFKALRDRSLTSKNMSTSGKVRVVKSRNITPNGIVQLEADQYVDSTSASPIAAQYAQLESVVVAPNLSYYPRATLLPKNSIVDGSAAVLVPKNESLVINEDALKFFASKDFFLFYRIARNYATRSLNIDRNSVFYWGLPKSNTNTHIDFHPEENKSSFLFANVGDLFGQSLSV